MSDQTPSLLDDETLNESERALIEAFERRQSAGSIEGGSDALTSAEDLEEPTGTPGSTSESNAAPDATDSEGGQVASESDTTPPEGEPPVEGEDVGGEHAQSQPTFTFAGVEYNEHELAEAVLARDWITNLNQQQRQQVDALLSGQYVLTPAHEAANQPPTPAAATSSPSSSSAPSGDEGDEWLDPRAQAEITRLNQELTQIKELFQQSVPQLVQSQQQAELTRNQSIIDQAIDVWAKDYTLDEATLKDINAAVIQTGIFPSLVRQHNNDLAAATCAAFDMILWTTPQFRDKAAQQRATSILNELAQSEQDDKAKARKMSALSNSGGSVPRRELPSNPQTRDDRYAAMVEDIRRDVSGT